MKKICFLIAVLCLAGALCGCGAEGAPDIEKVLASENPWYEFEGELYRDGLETKWGEPETSESGQDIWNVDGKYVAVRYDGDKVMSIVRSSTMYAEIKEISGDLAVIEPAEGQWERKSGDKIFFSMSWLPEGTSAAVGTELCIEYDGMLMETYPMQINKPFHVEIKN